MALIIVTEFINSNKPFPRREKFFDSEYDMIEAYGFSLDEIENALKNNACLRGRYLLELAPGFMQNIARDSAFSGFAAEEIRESIITCLRETAIGDIIQNHILGLGRDDIKRVTGLSEYALRHIISRAMRKLEATDSLPQFLANLSEYRKLRDRRDVPVQIVKKTKITITMKG
jgi:hypothetical protein